MTVSWVGDISFSRGQGLPRKPDSVFAPVRSSLAADLVTGNLEGTLGRGGPSKCRGRRGNCHTFQAPARYARSVFRRTGFEVLNLANNHSRDFGDSGLNQTLNALKGAKPTKAMRMPRARRTVIWPLKPVWAMRAPRSALTVCRIPL